MLGKFIYQRRADLGLTRAELASKLGISRPTYTKIETGDREPTLLEAEMLAAEFGLTLSDFQAHRTPQRRSPPQRLAQGQARPRIRAPKENIEKFRQVLMYIIDQVGNKPNVGETVLHKLLYFIDFDYYEKYDESLTGVTYKRNHHGPTAVAFQEIVRQLLESGDLKTVRVPYHTRQQKKYLSLAPPDLTRLSAREIKHIDKVLVQLSDMNARELESYSHGDIPWLAAQPGQPLDYESVFYREAPYSVRIYDDEI